MNCREIRPALLEYVMEEVPAQDRAAISRHLETCSACSEEVGRVRQTLGVLAQSAAAEDIPQKIRIVAEPVNRWVDFWRAPARLAFAAGALACVAIASLALARAAISYQDGKFEIAFGAAAASGQSPAAAPLPRVPPSSADLASGNAAQSLSRSDVLALLAEAVAASEARQSAGTTRIIEASVKASAAQAEANRMSDRRELAESFRMVQANQVNMWKQQVENQQMVSALVERTGVELLHRP